MMQIIYKYLIREIIKYFAVIMTMVVGIYFIVDFFEKIDNFMNAGAPLTSALKFFAYNLPFIIGQVLPVAILLSILLTFGLMSRHNEIIALRSSGVSSFLLFKPLAGIGIVGALLLFLLSEIIIPISTGKANRIYLTAVNKVAALSDRSKNLWIKGDHAIYHINYYDPANRFLFGLSAHFFDEQFRLIKRIEAKSGQFEENGWILSGLMLIQIDTATGEANVSYSDQQTIDLALAPEDLRRVAKSSKEMGFGELLAFIQKIEAEGYDANQYRVDLHAKIAFPVACVIMCLLGTGIAVRGKLREGIPVIIAYGISIAFIYWVAFSFFISLGYGDMLPPIVAAWAANIIFLCLGGIALIKSN